MEEKKKEKQMKRFFFTLIAIFVITISILSLFAYSYLSNISYKEGFSLESTYKDIKKKKTIKIGVVSRYSPSLIYDGYQPIIDYLNKNSDYYFELVLSKNYLNTVEQLKNKKIDFAFLGDMIFISNRKRLNLIPVVCPVNKEGKPYLKVATIVRDDSSIDNFCQLKGEKVALPSQSSFSSKWGLLKAKQCGISIKVKRFNFHHTVVLQVLNGVCTAGVVREYVAEEFKGKGIKIIDYSPPIPSPPLVTTASTDKKLIQTVQNSLLKFKGIKNSSTLIDKEFYYGFTVPDQFLYENFERFLIETGIYNEK